MRLSVLRSGSRQQYSTAERLAQIREVLNAAGVAIAIAKTDRPPRDVKTFAELQEIIPRLRNLKPLHGVDVMSCVDRFGMVMSDVVIRVRRAFSAREIAFYFRWCLKHFRRLMRYLASPRFGGRGLYLASNRVQEVLHQLNREREDTNPGGRWPVRYVLYDINHFPPRPAPLTAATAAPLAAEQTGQPAADSSGQAAREAPSGAGARRRQTTRSASLSTVHSHGNGARGGAASSSRHPPPGGAAPAAGPSASPTQMECENLSGIDGEGDGLIGDRRDHQHELL